MKKKTKSIASLLLAVMLVFSFAQTAFSAEISPMTSDVSETENMGNNGLNANAVSVLFSCSDSDIIMPKQKIITYDGIAEEYGYQTALSDHNENTIDSLTFFDVLVAAHKVYYGDLFTPESADNYLVMNKSFITKAFGKSAYSSGYIVNGIMPNDGIINELYGTYTGYSCDTAQIEAGDDITFYFYQDTQFWSDFYTRFDESEYTVSINEEFMMHIDGYCAIYYGLNDVDTINKDYAMPVTSGEIYIYNEDGTKTHIGSTDSNGNVNATFTQEGTYKIFVCGTTIDEYEEECPLIISWSEVTVSCDDEKETSFFNKIIAILKWIFIAPIRIIKYLIDLL